jgi:hypothetical protein
MMTDLEKYIWLFDNTGVKYDIYKCDRSTDLEILSESISTYGAVSLCFDVNGKFESFEVSE